MAAIDPIGHLEQLLEFPEAAVRSPATTAA
jgi:hypothetical protein